MGKIYMIGSQKGGTAKTTTTFNLAYCLRKMGKRVLAVDFDSQANLTTCFGVEDTGVLDDTIGHLMMAQIEDMKLPSPKKYIRTKDGVDFIPSSIYLSVVDAKLRLEMGAEKMLSGILEPLREKYDYILIDTCPSLGTLTINALAAADEVIITVNPQLLAMMGMQDFLRTVVKIRKRINPGLGIAGILMTMCESRTKLCKSYFNIILAESYDVTIQSKNTGHIWYIHNPEYPGEGECIIFHKHRASHPYHQHGRARSLGQAVRSIMGHDVFQLNVRRHL